MQVYMQVFGSQPCKHYVVLGTEEFAEKFLKGLKVTMDVKDIYVKNLALLVNSMPMIVHAYYLSY